MHALSLLPFDESLALKGATLVTAEGVAARLVEIDESAPEEFQLRVWLQGQPVLRSYCRNGRFRGDGQPDPWDLHVAVMPAAQTPELAARSLASEAA